MPPHAPTSLAAQQPCPHALHSELAEHAGGAHTLPLEELELEELLEEEELELDDAPPPPELEELDAPELDAEEVDEEELLDELATVVAPASPGAALSPPQLASPAPTHTASQIQRMPRG